MEEREIESNRNVFARLVSQDTGDISGLLVCKESLGRVLMFT